MDSADEALELTTTAVTLGLDPRVTIEVGAYAP